ncbi:glycosyltransferase [Salinibacterium sp. SYSU T00001]|uniref:glycosyltransferase n=1 Tax=Homoserinimonas sedimenticola TaxID=2986805 RepID=UPI0022356B6E|nr:glycosyltransferase [Salinibacterium sedimenticola]MCW4384759.1 glycosyltransferase [Salinibacterium sedimenticola]
MNEVLRIASAPAFSTRHANPYNYLLASALEGLDDSPRVAVEEFSLSGLVRRPPHIVHLHWPELTFLSGHRTWRHVMRLAVFRLALARARRVMGTRVIWTVHNPTPHEERSSSLVRRWYRRTLERSVDTILALSLSGVGTALREWPALSWVPAFVTPHGHYRGEYPLETTREDARDALGVDRGETVVLFAGQVRPYKNAAALVRAATALRGRPEAVGLRIVVAGKPSDDEVAAELKELAEADRAAGGATTLELAALDDERLALWLRAADLVTLPYRAIQNSGSAILALTAGRPVVVPAIGAMSELAEAMGPDWVSTYEGDFDAETLADAVRWLREAPRSSEPDLSALDWEGIARTTRDACLTALSSPPHSQFALFTWAQRGAAGNRTHRGSETPSTKEPSMSRDRSTRPESSVMLIATSGGHLTQLHSLRSRIAGTERVLWVTDVTAQSRSLLRGERVFGLPNRAPRAYLGVLRDAVSLAKVFRRENITHVYSTGAQMALSALLAAKIFKVPFSYIESGTRVRELSATGRVIDRIPGVQRYVQYPFATNDRWRFALSVFDGLSVEEVPLPPEGYKPRVVVSVGGNAHYGFERLIRRLHAIIPSDWSVLWQVGPTDVSDLDIETVVSLPAEELSREIAAADIVVSHAGTGSILSVLRAGKRPIVIPRRAAHGEHVDGHQDDLADYVSARGFALVREADELTLDDLVENQRWVVRSAEDRAPVAVA